MNSLSLRSATGATSIAFNSFRSAGELRGQFQAIQNNVRRHLCAPHLLTPLGLPVPNPSTQANVQVLAHKLDELINTLSA